jgi:predicted permease
VVGERFGVDVNNLLLAVVAPCAMLSSASAPFTSALAGQVGVAALIAAVYFALAWPALALVARTLPLPAGDRRMFVNLAVMANTGFIGFPVAFELFGGPGLLCAVGINLLYNLVAFTVGVRWLAASQRLSAAQVLLTPPLVSAVAAIGLFLAPFRLPGVVQGALDMVAGMMTPLAMMIIGISLAESYLPNLAHNGWGYLVCLVRLLALPALVWGVLALAGVSGLGARVAVVLCALPSGTVNVILGAKHGVGYRFAVETVVQSNVLMFATLPLVLALPL